MLSLPKRIKAKGFSVHALTQTRIRYSLSKVRNDHRMAEHLQLPLNRQRVASAQTVKIEREVGIAFALMLQRAA